MTDFQTYIFKYKKNCEKISFINEYHQPGDIRIIG